MLSATGSPVRRSGACADEKGSGSELCCWVGKIWVKANPVLAPNRLRPIANLPLGDRTSCFSAAGEVVLEVMASTAAVALAETDLSEGRLTKTDLKKGNLSMVQCLQGQMLTRCWDLLKSLESLKFLESLKVSLANSSLYESRLTADLLQSGNSGWNRLCIKIASKSQ